MRQFTIAACFFLLSACSGSGSDEPPQSTPVAAPVKSPIVDPPVAPPSQPHIEFADAGPLVLFTGESFLNPVTDPRCEVSYHSNDIDVVTVDAINGRITTISPGSAEIWRTRS